MGHEDEPTDEYRFIGRARPPQPHSQPPSPGGADAGGEPEPAWDEPTMPVDDAPGPMRESTSRADKQRNQRH